MNLNSEIIVAAQLSVDGKRFKRSGLQHVPYSSSAEVLATIPSTRRHVGQLFTISNGGSIEDWHFVDGIADGNLVKKDTGSGSSLVYRGAWDVATTYVMDDVVNYNGSSFLALTPSTGVAPVGDSTWGILAEKGDIGAQGVQGVQGIQGEPGTPASDMLNAPLYFDSVSGLIKIDPADESNDGYLPATFVQQILEDFAKWVLAADSLYTFKKVGLGIETPTERLDIDGNIKFREYFANQKYGKILHFGNYTFWDTVPANPDEVYAGRGAGAAAMASKYNVGIGAYALGQLIGINDVNNTGWFNTAVGKAAGFALITGKWNTFIGANCAGSTGSYNTYVATNPGGAADTGDNNIVIGHNQRAPVAAGSNQLNIGGWVYGAGGNIGIGITGAVEKLQVAGSILIDNAKYYKIKNNSGVGIRILGMDVDDNLSYGDYSGVASTIFYTKNSYVWYAYPSNVLTRRMVLATNGNLGIGVDVPAEKLDVGGSIRQSGVTNAAVLAADSNGKIVASDRVTSFAVTFDGTTGKGAIGSVTIPTFSVATGMFISDVFVKATGLTGTGAIINLGIATDGTDSGLNDTTGAISALNNTITRVALSTFTPSTATRSLVMSVGTAAITAGTISIEVRLVKL